MGDAGREDHFSERGFPISYLASRIPYLYPDNPDFKVLLNKKGWGNHPTPLQNSLRSTQPGNLRN
jgi:hypothetical protein